MCYDTHDWIDNSYWRVLMLQIEKLQKEKQELQIVLDMYGQEGYDNRYILLRVWYHATYSTS